MPWDGFWSGLVQLLGTLFAVGAVAAGVVTQQRQQAGAPFTRVAAALLGLVELAVGSFIALASLAPPTAWGISVLVPVAIGLTGLVATAIQHRMYFRLIGRQVPLDEFDREQRWGSIVSISAYCWVIATAFVTSQQSDFYWLRAIPPCWLAISGTWEQIAYLGNFTSLFKPR